MRRSAFIGPILFLAAWGLVARFDLIDPFFLPGPVATLKELLELLLRGVIVRDLLATVSRVAIAFGVALCLGVPLGLVFGSSAKLYGGVEFIVDFFRSTPSTAIFPLFLLIFGISDASKIAVAAFGAALIIIFNTAYGLLHASRSRILAARLMGASKLQIFRWVLFWESLPQTFVGMRSAVSLALVIVIVTEMFIGTSAGLGRRIIDYQLVYDVKAMYATIMVTGLTGYILNGLLLYLERHFVHWTGR